MILAGDVGGTHTRLALFDGQAKVAERRYPSAEFPGLIPILQGFLKETKAVPSHACFGIPGPVAGGRAQVTNLPWLVDAREISRALHIEQVSLLNDLEASAWGIDALKTKDLSLLHGSGKKSEGNRALVSAGTGLGEAAIFWWEGKAFPMASEGGHVDFAPRTPLEGELLAWLKGKFGHVSYERVLSGPGLQNLYEFLLQTDRIAQSEELRRAMKEGAAPLVISEWASRDVGCQKALDWWASLYGAECGNVALKFLAKGGVYLGGGMAPSHLEALKRNFSESFADKGRMSSLLDEISVWVILNDDVALLGAKRYAMRG